MSEGVRALLRYLALYVGLTLALLGWWWLIVFLIAYGN